MPTRTITPGARLKAAFCGSVVKTDSEWEEMAKECGIQPLTEEVPPTDAQLWGRACQATLNLGERLAEFLRLVRERDGEPRAVTSQMLHRWSGSYVRDKHGLLYDYFADRINAHRGVRSTELPKVTAEMWRESYRTYHTTRYDATAAAADYLNAELAKLSGKDGE